MSTDKIKVAVRVRPFNRRGKLMICTKKILLSKHVFIRLEHLLSYIFMCYITRIKYKKLSFLSYIFLNQVLTSMSTNKPIPSYSIK